MANGKYHKWLEPEGLILLEGWARNGLTDKQISENIGITRETFYQWKKQFSDFSDALKKGKEVSDYMVENSLFLSAIGHTKTVRKPFKVRTEKQVPGKGKIVEERIEYADSEIYIPPQITAQIFWLKNRVPEVWRDKPEPQYDEGNDTEDSFLKALEGSAAEDWADEENEESV